MERPFDDAAMLHFIRDSLFRTDSPLHHEFSISLEKFIAEPIASRESEWFPCISRDLHSLSQKLADTQARVIELEQCIDALQTTAPSATAATDHRVDTLQSSTENATQAAVSGLRRVEHELSQCYVLVNEFARVSSQQPGITSRFHNNNHSCNHNHNHTRLLRAIRRIHRRAVHLSLRNKHLHNHLSSTQTQRTNSQFNVLQHLRF